jgi:extracellular factor (EF) 3-hydroxypalmitic acid methyl ester biosynthesis protein
MNAISTDHHAVLDESHAMLIGGRVSEAFERLVTGLQQIRERTHPGEWKLFSRSECLKHPIRALIHQSPFSRRAFEKPRGYAGDAETLDFAYGYARLPEGTTPLGAELYLCEREAPSVKSARDRIDVLASAVDRVARQTGCPRVLSVACGHLREAQVSRAVAEGKIADYVALDHDPVSLALINRELHGKPVRTVQGSVKSLLKREMTFNDFDLVYSAGLYDYLARPVATALTALMFSMLRPGGRLLIANYAKGSDGTGYMESFMGWHLIYRDEADIRQLAASIDETEIRDISTFRDLHQNVVFLEVNRQ